MRQLSFFAKKDNYALVNRLIRECNVEKEWHFWGCDVSDYVYFIVRGQAKYMVEFWYRSQCLNESLKVTNETIL